MELLDVGNRNHYSNNIYYYHYNIYETYKKRFKENVISSWISI